MGFKGRPCDLDDAEARFNASVAVHGKEDKKALHKLAVEHTTHYPRGIDPKHPRKQPAYANGHDRKRR